MAHTIEQVREQIEIVKQRIEDGRPVWRQLKADFNVAKAAGNKDEMKRIAAEMDAHEKVRVNEKADLYALMAEEKEMLARLSEASA